MRISDWSSDVCSSDLLLKHHVGELVHAGGRGWASRADDFARHRIDRAGIIDHPIPEAYRKFFTARQHILDALVGGIAAGQHLAVEEDAVTRLRACHRSEEHTSELQSLMRISYAVFCLKKKISISN